MLKTSKVLLSLLNIQNVKRDDYSCGTVRANTIEERLSWNTDANTTMKYEKQIEDLGISFNKLVRV